MPLICEIVGAPTTPPYSQAPLVDVVEAISVQSSMEK